MAEDIVERLDQTAEALSKLVDKLFFVGQRDAGTSVSQASACVEAAAQEIAAEITALRKERDELREARAYAYGNGFRWPERFKIGRAALGERTG